MRRRVNCVSPGSSGVVAAFPGAQGGGANSIGGRGGRIIEVTNLFDSGAGSLRAAVDSSGPRIVVFRVGGSIELKTALDVKNPYITIAGQTAPGGGILLNGKQVPSTTLMISTHDVIVRYLRSRAGRGNQPAQNGDAADVHKDSYNVIIDHCSFSWALDENLSTWGWQGIPHHLTFSWNIISEGLLSHSKGILTGSDNRGWADQMVDIDIHHNLLAHNDDRHPEMKHKRGRVVNNIFYNWGRRATLIAGGVHIDHIGNLYKKGPNSTQRYEFLYYANPSDGASGDPSIYIRGNTGPNQINAQADNWVMTQNSGGGQINIQYRRANPLPLLDFPISEVLVTELDNLLLPTLGASQRLDESGAWVSNRDSVDMRVISEYQSGIGKHISNESEVGGFPTISGGIAYADSDHDGIADAWEKSNGLNPLSAADGNQDVDGDGYTNVEEFLNGQISGTQTGGSGKEPGAPNSTAENTSGSNAPIQVEICK